MDRERGREEEKEKDESGMEEDKDEDRLVTLLLRTYQLSHFDIASIAIIIVCLYIFFSLPFSVFFPMAPPYQFTHELSYLLSEIGKKINFFNCVCWNCPVV